MPPLDIGIHHTQAQALINRLIAFCGRDKINKGIRNYKKTLQSHGEIYTEFIRHRHPWWRLLIEFDEIAGTGKSFNRHILDRNQRIKNEWIGFLEDAKKLSEMYRFMPEEVRKFYQHTLVDDNNAKSHLFELDIAWHFLRNGHEVKWVQSGKKKPEFVVSRDDFKFCVECKRIHLGSYRKVTHGNFYRFCDYLLPALARKGIMGAVDLSLNDRLPSAIVPQREICRKILANIEVGRAHKEFEFGNLNYDMNEGNSVQVNIGDFREELLGYKSPDAFGVAYTGHESVYSMNPILFTCSSQQKKSFADKVFRLIKKAAKEQLDRAMPGIISVYLPEINDFSSLQHEGGLPAIAEKLFGQERFNHVGSIVFSSDPFITVGAQESQTFSQALNYNNTNCQFELAEGFPFFMPNA